MRLHGDRYTAWKYGIGGAHGLAVSGDRAFLMGGHRPERGVGRVVELGPDGATKVLDEVEVVDPDGGLLDDARALGCGSRMYFFRRAAVFVLEGWEKTRQ